MNLDILLSNSLWMRRNPTFDSAAFDHLMYCKTSSGSCVSSYLDVHMFRHPWIYPRDLKPIFFNFWLECIHVVIDGYVVWTYHYSLSIPGFGFNACASGFADFLINVSLPCNFDLLHSACLLACLLSWWR